MINTLMVFTFFVRSAFDHRRDLINRGRINKTGLGSNTVGGGGGGGDSRIIKPTVPIAPSRRFYDVNDASSHETKQNK